MRNLNNHYAYFNEAQAAHIFKSLGNVYRGVPKNLLAPNNDIDFYVIAIGFSAQALWLVLRNRIEKIIYGANKKLLQKMPHACLPRKVKSGAQ